MDHPKRRQKRNAWKGLAAGLIGGLVASWTMNQFQAALSAMSEKKDEPEDQGDNATVKAASAISEGLLDHTLTKQEKEVAGPAVHYVFGTSTGAVYGALAEMAPVLGAGAGVPFGIAFWLVADEGAVPALGLSKAPTEYPASTHAAALAAHCVYGLTADIVRRAVRRLID